VRTSFVVVPGGVLLAFVPFFIRELQEQNEGVSLTLTVTLLAALPWFVTSADVCIIALAATCETRPVTASATFFVSPMSVA
jgi:hypothetical protein